MTRTAVMRRVRRSLRGCTLKLSLRLCLFEEEFTLDFFGFLIALPFMDRWHRMPHECMESWGCYYSEKSFVVCRGAKTKFYYMPWMWDHCVHEVRNAKGEWVPYVASYEVGPGKLPDGREEWVVPYTYTLRSGEVQNRLATVHVTRRIWKWRWFRKLPYPKLTRQSIDVMFDGEVGERTGSWKGGCIGCGWDLRSDETAIACLRRMESERVFN